MRIWEWLLSVRTTCILSFFMSKSKFRLDESVNFSQLISASSSPSYGSPSPLPTGSSSDTSSPLLQTGDYDTDAVKWCTLSWNSAQDMQMWLKHEQESSFVELRLKERKVNVLAEPRGWKEKYYYVCARQGTGGDKLYVKKFPDRDRKIPTKRTGCNCSLQVRYYPNTSRVLGKYVTNHSHPIGSENARYTRLSLETQTRIAEMIRMGITQDKIVSSAYTIYYRYADPGVSFLQCMEMCRAPIQATDPHAGMISLHRGISEESQ